MYETLALYTYETVHTFSYDGNTTYALESAEASVDGTARFLKNGTAMTPYYTIRDHIGSARTIVNASGTVVERNDYYPFGSRTTFGTSYPTLASNRQKFSGKEDQTAVAGSTLPYLDFGARMYDAKLVRWNTYDPMAEKYYGINPYVYCNGDPMSFVDPSGNDIWEVNNSGKIIKRERDAKTDTFFLVNEKGTRTKSISFNYGTIESTKRRNIIQDYTSINITTDNAGADLFKFLADNLKIEFGLITMGEKGSVIVTTHHESEVPVSNIAKRLNRDRDTHITKIIHNHPGNSAPSQSDIINSTKVRKAKYYIYQPEKGVLIPYGANNKDEKKVLSWEDLFPRQNTK